MLTAFCLFTVFNLQRWALTSPGWERGRCPGARPISQSRTTRLPAGSELCSPSPSARDRHIFHRATCKPKAVFKGIVGFWSNAIASQNIMKTLTFNQKALKEPINMCMEMLPWYLAKVSVSAPSSPAGYIPRNARQQRCQPLSCLSAQPHL